jgi:hypothetical protein
MKFNILNRIYLIYLTYFLLVISINSFLKATEIFISPLGSDKGTGAISSPLQTIQYALKRAVAGDIIYLNGGTYRESISLIGKSGLEGAPITIEAIKGENPVISGLDVLNLDWKKTDQQGVYVASFETKFIRQLFYNSKPLLEARWPKCPKDKNGDWNFFSPDVWASAEKSGNLYGSIVCKNLAKTGWDVTGAQALLNVDHQFFCWTRPVIAHKKGSDTFTYNQDLGKSVNKRDEAGILGKWNQGNKFYLFGLKQFLGMPGEWYYDISAKKLYLFSIDGRNPCEGNLEIKTRDWGILADSNSNYLMIDGIGFFATAFKFGDNPNRRSKGIKMLNCTALYSSWTEFLSPKSERTDLTIDSVYPTILADNSIVQNCVFKYGALTALSIGGFYNRIENNIISDFDISSSLVYPPLHINRSVIFDGKGGHDLIRYNTICRSGGIQAQMTQNDCEFTMNDVHDSYLSCYGGNKDTSAVYTQRPSCTGTRIHHNWVHEGFSGTPPLPWGGGTGIRGDDNTCGLTVDHNVVWDCGSVGITIKNVNNPIPEEANRCANNTVFNHSDYNKIKSAIIIPTVVGKSYYADTSIQKLRPNAEQTPNAWSTVANNLAYPIFGMWFATPLGKLKFNASNITRFDARSDLVDINYYDFRPAVNAVNIISKGVAINGLTFFDTSKAPDIGAYQRGDKIYWIPGRREIKSSFPIVPDKSLNIPVSRDVLMWRPAYQAVSHIVIFSLLKECLDQCSEKTIKRIYFGEDNIFLLPKLKLGNTYYWRVDAIKADASIVKGDVWSFST